MTRLAKVIGDFGESAVLRDQRDKCEQRGWGCAVPLSPNFPADILVSGPFGGLTFIEVKTTTRKSGGMHGLSKPEREFQAECDLKGWGFVVATVRLGRPGSTAESQAMGGRWSVTSLSYSPAEKVRANSGRRMLAQHPQRPDQRWEMGTRYGAWPRASHPPSEPTSAPGSERGTALHTSGTSADSFGGATASWTVARKAEEGPVSE